MVPLIDAPGPCPTKPHWVLLAQANLRIFSQFCFHGRTPWPKLSRCHVLAVFDTTGGRCASPFSPLQGAGRTAVWHRLRAQKNV